ncbi:MAG: HEAT repeat domain-containing protein [Aggregatilineales bacterium]
MLENLDKVNWSELEHAYGSAEDVPDLIRGLLSDDEAYREQVWGTLYGNIWHQGTVYEATAYAVPFLIELLESPDFPDKVAMLNYLSTLAQGNSYHDVHQHLSFFQEEDTSEMNALIAQELQWVKDAREGVYQHYLLYAKLLHDDDRHVRLEAVSLIGVFDEHPDTLLPILRRHLASETDIYVRTKIMIALGRILSAHEDSSAAIVEPYLASENPMIMRFMAAQVTVWIKGEDTPSSVIDILKEAVTQLDVLEDAYEQMDADRDDVLGALSATMTFLKLEDTEKIVAYLIQSLDNLPFFRGMAVSDALLSLLFEGKKVPDGTKGSELTVFQRELLRAISDNVLQTEIEGQVSINGNASNLLRAYGLPSRKEDIDVFLAE